MKVSRTVGSIVLDIVKGDITAVEAEAIVNAANNHLWMGGGVAGAIKRAGGSEIEREAVSRGPIEVGTAVATGAGKLPYRYIIHGAVMGQELRTNGDLIARTVQSCLELAEKLGVQSVALPALGTGVGGFSMAECARVSLTAVRDLVQNVSLQKLQRVIFCLWGDEAYQRFAEAAEQVLGSAVAPKR